MTKDEMITLLRSVNCDENTVTAMNNAYELGFDQGVNAGQLLRDVIIEAEAICHVIDADAMPSTTNFWDLRDRLKDVI